MKKGLNGMRRNIKKGLNSKLKINQRSQKASHQFLLVAPFFYWSTHPLKDLCSALTGDLTAAHGNPLKFKPIYRLYNAL